MRRTWNHIQVWKDILIVNLVIWRLRRDLSRRFGRRFTRAETVEILREVI